MKKDFSLATKYITVFSGAFRFRHKIEKVEDIISAYGNASYRGRYGKENLYLFFSHLKKESFRKCC
jgi:hypothetical protein